MSAETFQTISENHKACKNFDSRLKGMSRIWPLTFLEDRIDRIFSDLKKLNNNKNFIIELFGGYSLDSFDKVIRKEDNLLFQQERRDELTEILIKPQKMLVHINEDMKKDYIMIIAKEGKRCNAGIENDGFEDIGTEVFYKGKGFVHNHFNIYEENFPLMIHARGSFYSKYAGEKDNIFKCHYFNLGFLHKT